MVKAEVKNLRRVKTGVWVGGKRYIFPAGIQVRMNLTDEMLRELQRNNAFSVKVVSAISDGSGNKDKAQKPSVEQKSAPVSETVEDVIPIPPEPEEPVQVKTEQEHESEEAYGDLVEVDQKQDEPVEAEQEQDQEQEPKKEIFTMKKDELAAYLASKGIDTEGMSRRDMLKAAKRI